jgi:eukaryotic-like serine/threonine-protein kinase
MHSGQQVRDYILEEKIGEGGMGEVWKARHQVLGRQVAIKVMARHIATDPEFEERFVQEARAQGKLQHPRILGVTDFFLHEGAYYLVMPLIEGESLEDRLLRRQGPLAASEALAVGRDLLDALDYAHQRGIVHRDVKPSNVLLDLAGNAYLMDFGIALLVGQDRKTRTGTSLGTPHYMSPEQIRTPKDVNHLSDVYSVGCVLYECLTGRPPFLPEDSGGDTDFAVKQAHVMQAPISVRRFSPGLSVGLDEAILRALAKDPRERYSGCGEFQRALAALGVAAAPTPPLQVTPVQESATIYRPSTPPLALRPLAEGSTVAQQQFAATPERKLPVQARPRRLAWLLGGAGLLGCLGIVVLVAFLLGLGAGMGGDDSAPESQSLFEGSSVPAARGPSSGDDQYRRDINTKLSIAALAFTQRGFASTHDPFIAKLAPDASGSVTLNLEAGTRYVIVSVCDQDCSDLDLFLFDENDNAIGSDIQPDALPVVEVTPRWTGQFALRMKMEACNANYCYYGIGVYGANRY